MKPQVGFNWNNGRLIVVTVTFLQLYETRPLPELTAMVRHSVISHFQQPPETIVLAFSLDKTPPGTAAQLNALPASEIRYQAIPPRPVSPDRLPRGARRRT